MDNLMLRFTTGDMFETPADIRVNTVNCVGVMGAGVALAFKNRFREMFNSYKRECDAGRLRPGELHVWKTLTGEWIINFPTKRHWRDKSRYEDIEAGLVALRRYLAQVGNLRVTLPALGCGHGGLDWIRVSEMIRQHLDGLEANIVVFDPEDSRVIGRKVIEDSTPTISILRAGDDGYPGNLSRWGINEIHHLGGIDHTWKTDVAVILSPKPGANEEGAAISCVSELARPEISIAVALGSAVATKLAIAALDKKANVTIWVPQGLSRYQIPKSLRDKDYSGQLSLWSMANSNQSWNQGIAAQTSIAALATSTVSLVTDTSPHWLSRMKKSGAPEHMLFYIRYQLSDTRWADQDAVAIGRKSPDGRPNIEPVLNALFKLVEGFPRQAMPSIVSADSRQYSEGESMPLKTLPVENFANVKRLIEVDLPIKRISAHARREKSIRHGHISTLHIWWARRPLAACRAVICAALWPDPADQNCPKRFKDEAKRLMLSWANDHLAKASNDSLSRLVAIQKNPQKLDDDLELRKTLLDFIADFSNWDNSTVKEYLNTSRALTQVAHESLGGTSGTRPLVVDPFCGGGSIPLEALRVGADAFASDLNPIPVLLNKVVLEYIPKYGQRLADEVRKWGEWIKKEAEKELAEFYPKDPDGATPIAYLWARTIKCEGPECGAEVPLMRSLWLAKKGSRSVGLRIIPMPKNKRVDFEIIQNFNVKEIGGGTVARGSATCPCCNYTTPVASVRKQLKARRGGASDARLFCVVTTRPGVQGRFYRLPTDADLEAVGKARDELDQRKKAHTGPLSLVPDESAPPQGALSCRNAIYGLESWGDFFTNRQALSLTTLARLIRELPLSNSLDIDSRKTMFTLLALLPGKQADLSNSLCRWEPNAQCPRALFGRQAIPMVWDFAEGVPIGESSGALEILIRNMENTLVSSGCNWGVGTTQLANASMHPLPADLASSFFTDPPYYDAINYSNISDFFYVWLRRCIGQLYPDLFNTQLTDKENECVVNPIRDKGVHRYEDMMRQAMTEGRRVLTPSGIGVIVFAHKSTAGWEAQLSSMLDAGWIVTASWPVDTECGSRMNAMGTAALASSVHIVCRPREDPDGSVRSDDIGDWRDVLNELPRRIHEWMPRLADEGVVGADAIFACLGPALEIFSRYSRVEKTNGEVVTLKEYLEHVWAAVAREALTTVLGDVDSGSLEPDARLSVIWLWTIGGGKQEETPSSDDADSESEDEEDDSSSSKKTTGGFVLEFDAARKIAQGLGAKLEELAHTVEIKGDKARLLPVAERMKYLFGKKTEVPTAKTAKKKKQLTLFAELEEVATEQGWGDVGAPTAGETTLDRIHQAMLLFAAGRSEALKRFLVEEGIGQQAQFWKLAQSLSALYPSNTDEKRWVDGILARKKGLGFG
jgi:putative DNA methylase